MKALTLLSFPARPIQGGRLELAPPKRGLWFAEPKLNGWRAVVHTPSGTMWNRHGTRLTIAGCFRPALEKLRALADCGLLWADCEALARRHRLGRGTLIVLDFIPETGAPTYLDRRASLESWLTAPPVLAGDLSAAATIPTDTVCLVPKLRAEDCEQALTFYRRLRAANVALHCEFFEGVVMKEAGSRYPLQLRNPAEEYPRLAKAPLGVVQDSNCQFFTSASPGTENTNVAAAFQPSQPFNGKE